MPATLNQGSDVPNSERELAQLPNTHYLSNLDNRALEERARQIGASLGRAVAVIRSAGSKIKDTASEATNTAASQISGAKQQIRRGYEETKTQAQRLVRDYPVHVVLGAGLLGLVVGASLRIWRANR